MNDQSSIQYISALLSHPGDLTPADRERVSSLTQSWPFFAVARYLSAKDQYAASGFTPELLSSVRPYTGNWLLFCDYMENGVKKSGKPVAEEPPIQKAQEEPKEQKEQKKHEEQKEQHNEQKEVIVEQPVAIEKPIAQQEIQAEPISDDSVEIISEIEQEQLILPVYTEDYFLQQGIKVSDEMPGEISGLKDKEREDNEKSLMVMMSFGEWLHHFKSTSQKEKEEHDDRKVLRTMWQKEKLAAAIEEENEEIPEEVFEMAVNSIAKEEDLASESLADIYIKQGKYDKAIEMYRKLSLRNPQKSTYFARKIEEVLKDKQS